MRLISILLLLSFLSMSCSRQIENDFVLNPEMGKVYSYEISNSSKRSANEKEDILENLIEFDMIFKEKTTDGFLLDITIKSFGLSEDTHEESDEIMDFFKEMLIGKAIAYKMESGGKLVFTDTSQTPYFQRMMELNMLEDELEYQLEVYDITLGELKKNLFNEWINYLPEESQLKSKKWQTSNDLNFANTLRTERMFDWKIKSVKENQVAISGFNELKNIESKMEMGMGVVINTLFEGKMTFSPEIVFDPTDGMLISSEFNIDTDGYFTKNAQGLPPGMQPEFDKEELKGIAVTKIRRI
jgi:hypothetical protein